MIAFDYSGTTDVGDALLLTLLLAPFFWAWCATSWAWKRLTRRKGYHHDRPSNRRCEARKVVGTKFCEFHQDQIKYHEQ